MNFELPTDFFVSNEAQFQRRQRISFPCDYVRFLETTGGGYVNDAYSWIYSDPSTPDPDTAIEVSAFFGSTATLDLKEHALGVTEAWNIADWGIFIAEGSNRPEDRYLLNLANASLPLGGIVYDDEGTITLVAVSSSQFLRVLIEHSKLALIAQREAPSPSEKFDCLKQVTTPRSWIAAVTTDAESRRTRQATTTS